MTIDHTKEVLTTIDDKYSMRMDLFLVECCLILATPNVVGWKKSRTRQAIESQFSLNTIGDMVAYAIENEVDTISNMICRDCFGFSGGRDSGKCTCAENAAHLAELMRLDACNL